MTIIYRQVYIVERSYTMNDEVCVSECKLKREEYMKTNEYKVSHILFKYCRLANTSAGYVMEKITKPVVSSNGRYEVPVNGGNLALLAEGGFKQLSMDDNKVLCKYVAEVYRYDFKEFWNAVKYEAMRMEFIDRTSEDARAIAKAIANITLAIEK